MDFVPERHRSNDMVSGLLHLGGVIGAITVLVLLLVMSAGAGAHFSTSYALFGSGLILLYLASASYHLIAPTWPRTKRFAQRLDHALIAVLIAATYTPVLFLGLPSAWRWSLFGVIWGLALLCFCIRFFALRLHSMWSVALYLVMGWLILVAFEPLRESFSPLMLWLLALGGIAYTLGVVFFVLEEKLPSRRYFWMHEIFHVFVLAGSVLHAIVMFLLLP